MTLQLALQQLGWIILYLVAFFIICSVITSCIKQVISTYFLAKLAYTMGTKQDTSDVV